MTPTREQLASIEWVGREEAGIASCPACGRRRFYHDDRRNHRADCWLAACLAAPPPDNDERIKNIRHAVEQWMEFGRSSLGTAHQGYFSRGGWAYEQLALLLDDGAMPMVRHNKPSAAPPPEPCIGRDPLCPCQDGDSCHYRDDPATGTQAWPIPPQAMPPIEVGDWVHEDGEKEAVIVREGYQAKALNRGIRRSGILQIRKANGTVWTREPRR